MRWLKRAGAAVWIGVATPLAADAGTFKTIYSFEGHADGTIPKGKLLFDNGLIYGTTERGGNKHDGTVFSFDPASGTETVLHIFGGKPEGARPWGSMLLYGKFLYGTTYAGGAHGAGTIFRFDPATGAQTTLCSFRRQTTGERPNPGLTYHAGSLYGTTSAGGTTGIGTVFGFKLKSGKLTVLHAFNRQPDGAVPFAGLLFAGGLLYGTTASGGTGNFGTVFSLDPVTKQETILHDFADKPDGSGPVAGVILHNGFLYGSTVSGGAYYYGTVFAIDLASNSESIVYNFKGKPDAEGSYSNLLFQDGALFGTSGGEGANGLGAIFSINPASGKETILHDFTGADGAEPFSPLIYQAGTFYGSTYAGGAHKCRYDGCGTLYSFTP